MSEERFEAIEQRLDSLAAGQQELRREMHEVGAGLRREMHEMGAGLRREMNATAGDLRRQVNESADELGRQMRVLHEDTIDKIAALAPDFAPIRREFTEADDRLREEIGQRLDPLEALARKGRGLG